MAIWPHEETPLTEPQKSAYRHLLYQAMLDVRYLCQSRGTASWNPLEWRRQYFTSRDAGSLADWLHNLALYVRNDFRGFTEDWFWEEYEGLCSRRTQFGPGRYLDYRKHYTAYLEKPDTE